MLCTSLGSPLPPHCRRLSSHTVSSPCLLAGEAAQAPPAAPAPAAEQPSTSAAAASTSTSSSDSAAAPAPRRGLRLRFGAKNIPHPNKAHYGGEDAFFVSDAGAGLAGIADGVGGWQEAGINPAGVAGRRRGPDCRFCRDEVAWLHTAAVVMGEPHPLTPPAGRLPTLPAHCSPCAAAPRLLPQADGHRQAVPGGEGGQGWEGAQQQARLL